MDSATALLPEMIASHVSFINECTSESVADHVSNNDNDSIQDEDKHECAVSPDTNDGAIHGINSSNCLEQFIELMNCNKLDVTSSLALNLIQLLELDKMSSGSIDRIHVTQSTVVLGQGGGGNDNATVEGKD
jgi:hypothetical protein